MEENKTQGQLKKEIIQLNKRIESFKKSYNKQVNTIEGLTYECDLYREQAKKLKLELEGKVNANYIEKIISDYKKEELPNAEKPFHYEAEIASGLKYFIIWLKNKEKLIIKNKK